MLAACVSLVSQAQLPGVQIPISKEAEKGIHLFQNGELSAAAKAFERGVERDPKNMLCHYLLGCLAFEAKDIPKARRQFERVISISDQAHISRFLVELCERVEAKPKEALLDSVFAMARTMTKDDFSAFYESPVCAVLMDQSIEGWACLAWTKNAWLRPPRARPTTPTDKSPSPS